MSRRKPLVEERDYEALRRKYTTEGAWEQAGRRLPIAWSYGGGTQSAAIAVLVIEGMLRRPDVIVMADTSREGSSTWAYLDTVVQPALAHVGLRVEIAPHSLSTRGLYDSKQRPLMPVYTDTKVKNGELGQMSGFCSGEWKVRVVRRYLRSLGYGRAKRTEKGPVVNWLGMSRDEMYRLAAGDRKWTVARWPLIFDVPMSREECVRLVEAHGWPTPPKSSCWCCPHRGNAAWRDLRDNWPEDWRAAVELDYALRAVDPHAYLHRSGFPLDLAPIDVDDPEGELPCSSGHCFV